MHVYAAPFQRMLHTLWGIYMNMYHTCKAVCKDEYICTYTCMSMHVCEKEMKCASTRKVWPYYGGPQRGGRGNYNTCQTEVPPLNIVDTLPFIVLSCHSCYCHPLQVFMTVPWFHPQQLRCIFSCTCEQKSKTPTCTPPLSTITYEL